MITRAAADIAFELFTNRLLIKLGAIALDDINGRHDHAGCAKAALQAMILPKGFLHGMQLTILGQTLNRGDIRTLQGNSQSRARFDRLIIDHHYTGAALARITAHMRAGQTQIFAQELNQLCP